MTEEQLKKIMVKSTLETSDEFLDTLMSTIEKKQMVERIPLWWSFIPVVIASIILVLLATLLLFQLLQSDVRLFGSLVSIPKTPLFVMVTLIFLYYINAVIKLNENPIHSKKKAYGA
ncbi:hypothetical protein FK220_008560 [Flavobacteriaceae bacterium TP-CH-4]|uniref:Uncharacterized protein n=1 Tax=Pelagihabitans pacificus TaxID=2696054 RepID=A0A967EDJ1_9FLAO|nr:hypothetical protein [Pelagihabitans pacificus]NHF59388.1 hypothetical protein [Pelagihabitans pacificus]